MASVSKRIRKGLDPVCVERARAHQTRLELLKWVSYGRKAMRALDLALPAEPETTIEITGRVSP